MKALLFLLTCFIANLEVIIGSVEPVCKLNSGVYYGPKLPSLPTAFEAIVEANIVNKNYSSYAHEWYDRGSNSGVIGYMSHGHKRFHIYNYNYNEMISYDDENNCTVQQISTMRHHSAFGKNSTRIGSTAELFHFGAQFNETFMGNTTIRGIKCFHWQACINHENSSYTLDYYFSMPDWKMPTQGNNSMQVVRAVIQGISAHHVINSSDLVHNFSHIYDFFMFTPGVPKESVFQVPRGVFCKDMRDHKPLPKLKSIFTTLLEMLNVQNKTSSYVKEFYDINRRLTAYEYTDHSHHLGPARVVHDFNHGLRYFMTQTSCKISLMMPNNSMDAKLSDDHHHVRMKMMSEVIYGGNVTNFIYVGSTTERGVNTDIWSWKKIGRYSPKPVTLETFFSSPSWNMRAGSLSYQTQVPMRVNYYGGDKLSFIINYASFDAEPVPLEKFSIASCFDSNEKKYLAVRLKVDWSKIVSGHEPEFYSGVTTSIAFAANVSFVRVEGLKANDYGDYVELPFILLEKPSTGLFPPGFEPPVPESNLKDAEEKLYDNVMIGFNVVWTDSDTKKKHAYTLERWMGGAPTPPGPGPKPERKKGGVPPGAVAGLAILMLAIGICGGLAVAHVIMKRRGTSLFNYQRQE